MSEQRFMAETQILNVITIVCSRLKRAKGSYEVFKAISNLSLASKACKNYLSDEILVKLCNRYVRERIQFVSNTLRYFILKNKFDNFRQFADLLVKYFSKCESARLLNSLIEYVTQHAPVEFLRSYLDYVQATNCPKGSDHEDRFSFPFFRPRQYINAMKIAHTNRWIDKQVILYNRLFVYVELEPTDAASVSQAITDPETKLNFIRIHSFLNDLYRRVYEPMRYTAEIALESLLNRVPRNIVPENGILVTKELLQLPIERQPWFYGGLDRTQITQEFRSTEATDCFIVIFYGSRLFYHQNPGGRKPFTESTKSRLPRYGLENNKPIQRLELYEFYLRLANQDLEAMKELQRIHKYNWREITRYRRSFAHSQSTINQPNPLLEYLTVVDDIRDDIVEWLFELTTYEFVYFDWERTDLPEKHFEVVRRVIEKRATISINLLEQFATRAILTNRKAAFSVLPNSNFDIYKVWIFIFEKFGDICRQQRYISDTKMAVLLAWKKADGESIGLRNLPKELIQLIVGYLDEPSALTLANLFATLYPIRIDHYFDKKILRAQPWILQFAASDFNILNPRCLTSIARQVSATFDYKYFRRTKDWIIDIIGKSIPNSLEMDKFFKFLMKYETNLEKLKVLAMDCDGLVRLGPTLTIEALKTRNVVALRFLSAFRALNMPSREEFMQNIKPKHKITYEEALDICNQIEKQ